MKKNNNNNDAVVPASTSALDGFPRAVTKLFTIVKLSLCRERPRGPSTMVVVTPNILYTLSIHIYI